MRNTALLVALLFSVQVLAPAQTSAQTRMQRGAPEPEREELGPVEPADSQYGCYELGTQRADVEYDTGGWFAGGIASGVALGLIGTGILWAVSRGDVDVPPRGYEKLRGDCLDRYIEGYQDEARSKKSWAAVSGGVIGTAVIVGILLAAEAD